MEGRKNRANAFLKIARDELEKPEGDFYKIEHYLMLSEEAGNVEAALQLLHIYLRKKQYSYVKRQMNKIEKMGETEGIKIVIQHHSEKQNYNQSISLHKRLIAIEEQQVALSTESKEVEKTKKWKNSLNESKKSLEENLKKIKVEAKLNKEPSDNIATNKEKKIEEVSSSHEEQQIARGEIEESIKKQYVDGKNEKEILWEIYLKIKNKDKEIKKKEELAKIGNLKALEILFWHSLIEKELCRKNQKNYEIMTNKVDQFQLKLGDKQYHRALNTKNLREKKHFLECSRVNLTAVSKREKESEEGKTIIGQLKDIEDKLKQVENEIEFEKKQDIIVIENRIKKVKAEKIRNKKRTQEKKANIRAQIGHNLLNGSPENYITLSQKHLKEIQNSTDKDLLLDCLISLEILIEKATNQKNRNSYEKAIQSIQKDIVTLAEKYKECIIVNSSKSISFIKIKKVDLHFYSKLSDLYVKMENLERLNSLLRILKLLGADFEEIVLNIESEITVLKRNNISDPEERGNLYLKEENYKEALETYKKILNEKQTSLVKVKIGYCDLMLKNESDESKTLLNKKINSVEALHYLALFYYNSKEIKNLYEVGEELNKKLIQRLNSNPKDKKSEDLKQRNKQTLVLGSIAEGNPKKYENDLKQFLKNRDLATLSAFGLFCYKKSSEDNSDYIAFFKDLDFIKIKGNLKEISLEMIIVAAEQGENLAILFLISLYRTQAREQASIFESYVEKKYRMALKYLCKAVAKKIKPIKEVYDLYIETSKRFPKLFLECDRVINNRLDIIIEAVEESKNLYKMGNEVQEPQEKINYLLKLIEFNKKNNEKHEKPFEVYIELSQLYHQLYLEKKEETYLLKAWEWYQVFTNDYEFKLDGYYEKCIQLLTPVFEDYLSYEISKIKSGFLECYDNPEKINKSYFEIVSQIIKSSSF